MKRREFIKLSAILAAAGALAACGDSPSSTASGSGSGSAAGSTGKDLGDITIAYVTSPLTTQIFRDQVTAMEAYCKEIGVKFVYTAVEETEKQLEACDNYVAMGVGCLIVHVTSADTFADSMKRCQEAGIPWFSYDTKIEGDDAYYGWDNHDLGYAIGQNAANWVNENFGAGDTVYAASNNYPAADFLLVRENGYKEALDELCEAKIEWVVEATGGTTDNGVEAGENFTQCGYDLNLVCAINDSGLCGVYQAFNASNYGEGKTLALFGCDSDPEALAAIAEGGIYKGTINTGLVALAPEFIDIAVGLAQGDPDAKGDHWGDFILITKDNVAEWMD